MQQARVTLAASVASTYNQLAQLYALRDIAQREIANRKDVGRITNGRVTAGLDTNVERRTAEGNVATSQSNLTELDGQITTRATSWARCSARARIAACKIANPIAEPKVDVALPDNVPADLVVAPPGYRRRALAGRSGDARRQGSESRVLPGHQPRRGVRLRCVRLEQIPAPRAAVRSRSGPAIHLPIFDAGASALAVEGPLRRLRPRCRELQPDADQRAERRRDASRRRSVRSTARWATPSARSTPSTQAPTSSP